MNKLIKQFLAFFGVGIAAAIVHYGLLIFLVEIYGMMAVPATLFGYVAGGVVSYWLNERLTYQRTRSHGEAGWRFALVAAIGFGLTYLLMSGLVGQVGIPYLPAQLVTTGLVLVWSFFAHKLFSFAESAGR